MNVQVYLYLLIRTVSPVAVKAGTQFFVRSMFMISCTVLDFSIGDTDSDSEFFETSWINVHGLLPGQTAKFVIFLSTF